jgi:uncharacterized protein YajQ (UPF0234 family)
MKNFYMLHLQQFADGGNSGDASQAAAGTTGEGTEQAAAAGNETRATFEDLIKGEYKEDYDKAVQKIVRQRFSRAKADEEKLNKMAPILQALASKYGTDAEDIDSIAKYIEEDDELYEEAALKAGLTVDQYKRFSRMEAENQRLQAERELNEQRRVAQQQYDIWLEESEKLKAEFPDFDLNTYLPDERFQRLLKNGVGLREAYIALDADRILPGAMAYTAQQVAKKTAASIAQRGLRPMEGALSGQASSKAKTDVSKMTNAEIAEYVRRASRGERIAL